MVVGEASLLCGLAMLMGACSLGPEGPHFLYCMKKGASVLGPEELPLDGMGWPMHESLGKGSPYRRSRAKENTVLPHFPSPHPQHSAAGHRRARKTRVSVKNPVPALYAYFMISIAYMFPMGSMGL